MSSVVNLMTRGPVHTSPPLCLRRFLFDDDNVLLGVSCTPLEQQSHKNRSRMCKTLIFPRNQSGSHSNNACFQNGRSYLALSIFISNGMRLNKPCHIQPAFCDNKSFESEKSNKDFFSSPGSAQPSQAPSLTFFCSISHVVHMVFFLCVC